MDLILEVSDKFFFSRYVYNDAAWPVDDPYRQFLSLFLVTNVGGALIYLIPAVLSYIFLFPKELRQHKKFLKDQEWLEITYALRSVPGIAFPTTLLFVCEVRGWSKLYSEAPASLSDWLYLPLSFLLFMLFTDCLIYWIHRGLHHPSIYGSVHKPHHKWLVPTPFASHAFHWLDGFLQSLPYHLAAFVFPLHRYMYLGCFVFVNVWSTSIHDGVYRVPAALRPFINGSAHHTDHHLFYEVNYGQYTTLWDRLGGTFKEPTGYAPGESLFDDLRRDKQKSTNTKSE